MGKAGYTKVAGRDFGPVSGCVGVDKSQLVCVWHDGVISDFWRVRGGCFGRLRVFLPPLGAFIK